MNTCKTRFISLLALMWFMISVHAQVQFSEQKIILSSATLRNPLCVHTADLDGDGDVLSASENDNKIAWYENLMGSTGINNDVSEPVFFCLYQNYPNPFNPETAIQFDLPQQAHVTVCIYDILGKKVATIVDQQLEAGQHEIQFHAEGLASGIYFYQIQMGEYRATKKMLLNR